MVLLGVLGCTRLTDCVDTVLAESLSPDGLRVAVVFERDCGATTAKNTQVCFRKAQESFNTKEQVSFVVFESEKRPKLAWNESNKMTITLPAACKMFRQEAVASGITIKYVDGEL
jgi:hypothetical protein